MKSAQTMLLLMAAILAVSLYSLWNEETTDSNEQHHHDAFFKDVRKFMSKGGRNTAEHGIEECMRLNELSMLLGHELLRKDCKEFYK